MKNYNGSGILAIWKLTQLSQSFVAARRTQDSQVRERGRTAWLSMALASHQDPWSQVQGKDGRAQLAPHTGGCVTAEDPRLANPDLQRDCKVKLPKPRPGGNVIYNLLVSEKICPLPWREPTTHLPLKGFLVQNTLEEAQIKMTVS